MTTETPQVVPVVLFGAAFLVDWLTNEEPHYAPDAPHDVDDPSRIELFPLHAGDTIHLPFIRRLSVLSKAGLLWDEPICDRTLDFRVPLDWVRQLEEHGRVYCRLSTPLATILGWLKEDGRAA